MAIEFNCPYCTAAIRVPDEFSGKRGSCPKCTTKLLVPDVVPRPGAVSDPMASDNPAVPQPAAAAPTPSHAVIPPVVPPAETSSVSRSLRKKRRRGKSMGFAGMLVPAVCFLAFIGVLALVFMLRPSELKGTLNGSVATNMSVPTVNVPLARLDLTESEQEQASLAFRDKSESFLSVQMTCSVELNGSSLAIDVEPGDDFSWYTVNPGTDVVLRAWINQNVKALDGVRVKQASAAGADLCRDKIIRANGTPVELAAERYRDAFGLSFHAKGFGYGVEAVAGKRRSLCAHEDTNGTLYFILPTGTTEFLLRGRSVSGGNPLFSGEYRVVVSGTNTAAAVTAETVEAEAAPDTAKESAGEEPMLDSVEEQADKPMPEMMSPM